MSWPFVGIVTALCAFISALELRYGPSCSWFLSDRDVWFLTEFCRTLSYFEIDSLVVVIGQLILASLALSCFALLLTYAFFPNQKTIVRKITVSLLIAWPIVFIMRSVLSAIFPSTGSY